MILFDLEYYRPVSALEAIQLFNRLEREGKQPSYLSGGTEHASFGRSNKKDKKVIIDLKDIPECRALRSEDNHLVLGSALTLTELTENNDFPLLSKAAIEVADHMSRDKITLGGNICGQVFYREAVLPFLLTDSKVMTLSAKGTNYYSIHEVFNQKLHLKNGEMLMLLLTEKRYLKQPFASIKVREQWDKGYPLVTVSAIEVDGEIRVAFSGICPFPFRSKMIESALNNQQLSDEEKVHQALQHLPQPILDDIDYRKFVIHHTLLDILTMLRCH
ncbi:FAD binding domain-containing protein [Bacillus sp. CLL-7-23]|uniref:FAD binding domain-containing protein n=1 Tax=Bacillus changyiensis TaxID=3004103 RepID=A0ABT4X854_9BACI|nr:FAD binding domain-containing protein [Bacillus changyiensis]MDA7027532.1 FAD binding domain-containing protein [Bacillus changyiensis]